MNIKIELNALNKYVISKSRMRLLNLVFKLENVCELTNVINRKNKRQMLKAYDSLW